MLLRATALLLLVAVALGAYVLLRPNRAHGGAHGAHVVRDGTVWTEYYTSRIDRDYPWLLAMFLPTDLRMARFPTEALETLSAAHP